MKRLGLVFIIFAVIVPAISRADDDCDDAVRRYNSRLSDLADAVKSYYACTSNSRGRDDCSSEFGSVRSDQDDFETAVRHIRSYCD